MPFPTNVWGSSGFPFTGNGFPVKRNKIADAIILALFSNNEQGAYYDPYDLTDEKLAWRRNLLLWSEDFGNAAWEGTVSRVNVLSNFGIAPDGTQTSDLIQSVEGSIPFIRQTLPTTYNGVSISFYVKKGSSDVVICLLNNPSGENSRFTFNFISESFVINTGDITSLEYEKLQNGWYRISGFTTSTTDRVLFYPIYATASSAVQSLELWGAQLEIGSVPTPYQRITNFNSDFMEAFPNHTLFQDSLGTIPVTGHMQPVGLVLDKRFGGVRGENLWESGNIVFDGTQSQFTELPSTAPNDLLSSEVFYEGIYLITITNGSCRIRLGDTASANVDQSGVYRLIARGGTLKRSSIQAMSENTVATISNIQIRPILGNHVHQPVSSARPLWQNNGGLKSFWFDGLDDHLVSVNELPPLVSVAAGFTLFAALDAITPFKASQFQAEAGYRIWSTRTISGSDHNYRSLLHNGNFFSDSDPIPFATKHVLTMSTNPVNFREMLLNTKGSQNSSGSHLSNIAVDGLPNWVNTRLVIGFRSSTDHFQGHLYGLIIRSTLTPETQAEPIRQLLATRSGVDL